MPFDNIIGAQWGDNASHTVTVGQRNFKLHTNSSEIARSHTVGMLGNGMLVNPATFLKEVDTRRNSGVDTFPEHLQISHAAHLISPAHVALDKAQEMVRGRVTIGPERDQVVIRSGR